jgi:hypothetical protein
LLGENTKGLQGAGVVTLARFHPGVAALAVVVAFTATLLIVQNVQRNGNIGTGQCGIDIFQWTIVPVGQGRPGGIAMLCATVRAKPLSIAINASLQFIAERGASYVLAKHQSELPKNR